MPQTVKPTGSRRPEFRSLEDRLRWARETAPLTQQELADHLGISRKTVQNYEAGVGHPKANRLILWANACDVDADWLAGDFYDRPHVGGRDEAARNGDPSARDTDRYVPSERALLASAVA